MPDAAGVAVADRAHLHDLTVDELDAGVRTQHAELRQPLVGFHCKWALKHGRCHGHNMVSAKWPSQFASGAVPGRHHFDSSGGRKNARGSTSPLRIQRSQLTMRLTHRTTAKPIEITRSPLNRSSQICVSISALSRANR